MEPKKSPKANLENKKALFFQIGLVTVLVFLLIAFEWTVREVQVNDLGGLIVTVAEPDIMPPTRQEDIVLPPPPPPQPADVISIFEDDDDLPDVLKFDEVEVTDNTRIDNYRIILPPDEEEMPVPFYGVEDMPDFQGGGQEEFRRWIARNLKYPSQAIDNNIQGTVHLSFVVNTDGRVTNVTITRGIDPLLDQEAMRVISSSPLWTPGKQTGRPVRVIFHFPVAFRLN
jgi:periplasmic protein TonB